MTAVELPNWVYDLVMDLQAQELHPRLLFESGAFEGTRQYDWCPCGVLAKVPAEVREQAQAIATYRRKSELLSIALASASQEEEPGA